MGFFQGEIQSYPNNSSWCTFTSNKKYLKAAGNVPPQGVVIPWSKQLALHDLQLQQQVALRPKGRTPINQHKEHTAQRPPRFFFQTVPLAGTVPRISRSKHRKNMQKCDETLSLVICCSTLQVFDQCLQEKE